jgi:hypothetical protein
VDPVVVETLIFQLVSTSVTAVISSKHPGSTLDIVFK